LGLRVPVSGSDLLFELIGDIVRRGLWGKIFPAGFIIHRFLICAKTLDVVSVNTPP
jgi:hypothetical protein